MFKSKKRIASAWAKGLMFGKAVGARDERDRIIQLLETNLNFIEDCDSVIELITGKIKCYCIGTWECPICQEGKND